MTRRKTIEKSKLIRLLSTFSTLEWKRFGRFVQSPYHNTNLQIVTLYSVLKKAFPFEESKLLEQERIFKKVYGKEAFILSKLQNLCSDLYELAIDFMLDVHLDKKKRAKKKLIVDMLSERNYELFKGASQQLIKEVETQAYFLDADDFLLLHQVNDGLYHHLETDKLTIQKTEMENSWKHLNAFYKHKQIGFKAENKGSQNFLNQNINSTNSRDNQLTKLFQEIINLHEHKDFTQYFQLKEKILACWGKLKHHHKTNLLLHLINFSFTNELLQKEFGHKESLELYKIGIKDKLFVINGKMRDIEFINISSIGFGLKDNKWTHYFIETHKQYLSIEERVYLVPLAKAYEGLFSDKYEIVIELLSGINPEKNLIYYSKIKMLLIRAFAQGIINNHKDYEDVLSYELNALIKWISRNQKLANLKLLAYSNFILILKKLLSLLGIGGRNLAKYQEIENLLNTTTPLVFKSWLNEKYNKIKNAVPNN